MSSSFSRISSKDEDTPPPLGNSEALRIQHAERSHVTELNQGPEKGSGPRNKVICGFDHVLVFESQSAIGSGE